MKRPRRARLRPAVDRGAPELVEDQFLIGERNPGAVVLDGHSNVPVVRPGGDAHLGTRVRVLDGVVDEVLHDLTNANAIAANARQSAVHLCSHADFVLCQIRRGDYVTQQLC